MRYICCCFIHAGLAKCPDCPVHPGEGTGSHHQPNQQVAPPLAPDLSHVLPLLSTPIPRGGEHKMPTAAATKSAPAKAKAEKKSPVPKKCLCGCGGVTKGGRFLVGHDAKLKSALVGKAKKGDVKAVDRLRELNWERYIPEVEAKAPPNGKTTAKNK